MKNTYKKVLTAVALVAIATIFMAFPASAQEFPGFLLSWRLQQYALTYVAVDSARQYVYVTQFCGHRVQKFDPYGNFLQTLPARTPRGVAVDSLGNVYVAEMSRRIKKFNAEGEHIGTWGSIGTGDGQFLSPRGIAIDSLDNIYVADTGNHRIQKFDADGNFITKWGSKGSSAGQFNKPSGIAVDSFDNVYVADTENHRIQKFNSAGNFITTWGSYGTGDGQLYWNHDVAVDSSGNVYATEKRHNRIQKFTTNGIPLGWWGADSAGGAGWHEPGSGLTGRRCIIHNGLGCVDPDGSGPLKLGDGQFYFPYGIAFDPSTGNFYVAEDSNNRRIQKFGLPCESITGNADVDAACCVVDGIYRDPVTGLTILGTYTGNFDEEIEPRKATHGSYVSCVAHMVNQLRREGEISKSESGKIVRAAGQSDVNKPEGSIR